MAVTWDNLVDAEPRLGALLAEAQAVKDGGSSPSFCANAVWYGYHDWRDRGFKARLLPLVGWQRKDGPELLRSTQAYDVAYQTVYDVLPDCRNCLCLSVPYERVE